MEILRKMALTLIFALMLVGLCPAIAWAESGDEDVTNVQQVGAGSVAVGDGVTATFDKNTGTVTFFQTEGRSGETGLRNRELKSIRLK